jgi:hypothetical protein
LIVGPADAQLIERARDLAVDVVAGAVLERHLLDLVTIEEEAERLAL